MPFLSEFIKLLLKLFKFSSSSSESFISSEEESEMLDCNTDGIEAPGRLALNEETEEIPFIGFDCVVDVESSSSEEEDDEEEDESSFSSSEDEEEESEEEEESTPRILSSYGFPVLFVWPTTKEQSAPLPLAMQFDETGPVRLLKMGIEFRVGWDVEWDAGLRWAEELIDGIGGDFIVGFAFTVLLLVEAADRFGETGLDDPFMDNGVIGRCCWMFFIRDPTSGRVLLTTMLLESFSNVISPLEKNPSKTILNENKLI